MKKKENFTNCLLLYVGNPTIAFKMIGCLESNLPKIQNPKNEISILQLNQTIIMNPTPSTSIHCFLLFVLLF